MLPDLLANNIHFAQEWQNILFKNILILVTSFFICLFAMKYFLKIINFKNICRQPIRKDGPATHLKEKKNTPTMGGLIIILSTVLTSLIWIDISNNYIIATLFVFLSFCLIGFIDDFIKVRGKNTAGFKGSIKLIIQFAIVGITLLFLQATSPVYLNNEIMIPFSNLYVDIGSLYIILAIIVIVGSANSVNLTDGLDGLVSVPAIITLLSLSLIAYFVSDLTLANKFGLQVASNAKELIFLSFALIGAILAFLKYNIKPAKIFMGDVGSLGIGATIGIIAVILKIEIIFFIIALLFVIEALSVILQVASFKIRKKRIFLMAPIHHHFEKLGWSERKVVRTFWLASLIFAIIGLLGIY